MTSDEKVTALIKLYLDYLGEMDDLSKKLRDRTLSIQQIEYVLKEDSKKLEKKVKEIEKS